MAVASVGFVDLLMRRRLRLHWVIIGLVAFLVVHCVTPLPLPTPPHVQRAQERWKFADSTFLAEARVLYSKNCGGCHRAYPPWEFSLKTWVKEFPEMVEEAKTDSATAARIWIYILTFQDTTRIPPAVAVPLPRK